MRRFQALLVVLMAFTAVPAFAAEGDTAAVAPERPAERELAAKLRVRKESIGDEEVKILDADDVRLRRASDLPRRTGIVQAGMGFAVLPPPVVEVESRPVRGADRGFRVER